MKVCLIAPITRRRELPRNYPMGLACIAASLREAGHEIEVLDFDINREYESNTEDCIKKINADVVGIGGLITTYSESKRLTEMVKHYHPETRVLIGGRMAASSPELWLEKTPADFIVEGEGEVTAVELLRALELGEDLVDVKGIWYREGDKYIRTLPREYIPDLDTLPRPAYDLFEIDRYISNWENWARGTRPIMMVTCRGCVVLCSFCYQGFGGFRQRSVESFMSEVEFLIGRYGIDTINFADSTLMVNKKFVEGFCNEVLRRNLDLKWYCASRVSDLSSKHEDLLRLMKEAGCRRLHFGVESGSPEILKRIKKGTSVEDAERSIHMARRAGLIVHTTFIYGLPGETEKTAAETASFCRRNLTPVSSMFYATAYPETELYSEALGKGKIVDEEDFISKLGDVDQQTINLSDIPDEDFARVKERVERETQIPIIMFLYEYMRRYGVRNMLRYLHFIWESYPTKEIIGRLTRFLKKSHNTKKIENVSDLSPKEGATTTKDLFPVS
jgi:anaerobic magnesium-protoporphyrin IX monomethyl ester cyclase